MNRDHRNRTERLNDAQAAWECARLLAMARAAAQQAAQIEIQLQAFDSAALHAEGSAALGAPEVDRLVAGVFALQDGVDVMGFVANRLRDRDASVIAADADVRAEVTRALAAGSADRSFVLLAASMLTATEGFPALADAITTDPSFVAEWSDLSVRDLLGAFCESDQARARRVCLTALVHPDAAMSGLDLDGIERLADALRTADV